MKQNTPKVIHEGKITLDGLEIRVCVLDNGQRIIPEEDFKKALTFLGISEEEMKSMLNTKSRDNENKQESPQRD